MSRKRIKNRDKTIAMNKAIRKMRKALQIRQWLKAQEDQALAARLPSLNENPADLAVIDATCDALREMEKSE